MKRVTTILAVAFVGLLLVLLIKVDSTEQSLISLNSRVDSNSDDLEGLKLVATGTNEPMVGASTLFAQNASVQLNLAFFGEIKPDGANCSNGEILKKTGADNWDCSADASGSISSNSLNFDEFQNPLVLDTHIQTTSGSFEWNWGATSLVNVGSTSFKNNSFVDFGPAGVRISNDGDGAITFLGRGDGNDENLIMNLDDTSNTAVFTTTTALSVLTFTNMNIQSGFAGAYSLVGASQDINNPTYRFGNDTNTGMWNPGNAGTIGFISDGVNTASISLNLLRLSGSASVSSNFEVGGYASISGVKISGDRMIQPSLLGDDLFLEGGSGGFNTYIDIAENYLELNNTGSNGIIWLNAIDKVNISNHASVSGNLEVSGLSKLTIASVSSNFEVGGYASASLYLGTAFGATQIDCNDATDKLLWSAGLFTCGTIASTDLPITGTWATTGNWTLGDGGDDVIINSDTWDVSNLGALTGVTGIVSTGLIDFGGADLEIPNGTPTLNSVGETGAKTASASSGHAFRVHDGTAERVYSARTCMGLNYPLPTAKDHITIWNAYDPFTISQVYVIASGSNAVGWQLRHGKSSTTLTDLFSTNKSASGSSEVTYTSFSDATLVDGERLDFSVTSASATIDSVFVRACGFYDP